MTKGEQGNCPYWYIVLRAADRVKMPVTELEKLENLDWVYRGNVAAAAESEAEEAIAKYNDWRRKNNMKPI
jgi:hypothetical protein